MASIARVGRSDRSAAPGELTGIDDEAFQRPRELELRTVILLAEDERRRNT